MGILPTRPRQQAPTLISDRLGVEGSYSSITDLGIILGPGQSLPEAIASLPATGGTITLQDGTWDITGTLTISKPNVTITSLVPGGSVIRRVARASNASTVMLNVIQPGFTLRGVSIQDQAAGGAPSVYIGSSGATIEGCVLQGVWPLSVEGDRASIHHNRFSYTGLVNPITIDANLGTYLANHIDGVAAVTALYASDASSGNSFVGNVYVVGGTVLSYKALTSTKESANIDIVTVRP